MPATYAIQVREVGVQPILSIRAVVPTLDLVRFFEEACDEMRAYAAQVGARTAGSPMSLWHSAPGEIPGSSDIETCLPIEGAVRPLGRIRHSELPAGLQAFAVHQGPYDDMGDAFDAVWRWIQEQGYAMQGPPRDVILVGPHDTADPTGYRTEIVYPVSARR